MEIAELKEIISEEIGNGEISNVILVFKEVLNANATISQDFIRERSRFNLLKKDYNRGDMPYDRYIIERKKIVESLTELQNQLIEDDLMDGWINLPVVQSYIEEEGEEEAIQDVALGKYSDIVLTQNAPSDAQDDELDSEAFEQLETLLIKTQDAIEVDAYDEAEKFCLEAKEIDKKNPQIYEYLALINFKRKSPAEIIHGAINENDPHKTLKHIFQYVRRFKQFSHKYREDAIGFAEENIKSIGLILTESIKKEYYKIANDKHKVANDKRDLIWKCLGFYKDVFELMNKPLSFIDTAILELSGSGEVLWLRVEKGRVKNRYGRQYNALDLRKDFINKLIKSYLDKGMPEEEATQKTEKRLANNFYYKINRSYNRVNQVKDPKTGRGFWTDQGRSDIIQYLNASKIGYLLFEDSEHLEEEIKMKFLELPYNEIIGEGKPFLNWLSLSNNGQLQTYYKAYKQKYHALNELEYLAGKLNVDFSELKVKLKTKLFERQLKRTQRLYDNAEKEMLSASPDEDKARENLIFYLEKQLILARQKIGEPESYIETPLKELSGNGFFTDWVQLNSEGDLENTATANALQFDAVDLIVNYLNCKKDYTHKFKDINESNFENLFKINYSSYQSIISSNSLMLPEDLAVKVIQHLKNFEIAFLATANTSFLKPIYDETSSGRWVFKDGGEYKNQPNCDSLGFDAVRYLKKIMGIINEIKSVTT